MVPLSKTPAKALPQGTYRIKGFLPVVGTGMAAQCKDEALRIAGCDNADP
jgi:hypothetical protein